VFFSYYIFRIIVTVWGESKDFIFLQCFDTVGWVISPVKTCPLYDL